MFTIAISILTIVLLNKFWGKLRDWLRSKVHPLIENKFGDGYAILLGAMDYPGHGSVYPLYRTIVREMISASARECELKVYAPDKLRYSFYEGNKLYLLNTDYDCPISAVVKFGEKTEKVTLAPMELTSLVL